MCENIHRARFTLSDESGFLQKVYREDSLIHRLLNVITILCFGSLAKGFIHSGEHGSSSLVADTSALDILRIGYA
jgi:hypothetical protein